MEKLVLFLLIGSLLIISVVMGLFYYWEYVIGLPIIKTPPYDDVNDLGNTTNKINEYNSFGGSIP